MIRSSILIIFTGLCVRVCYQDWKRRKIPNHLLGSGAVLVVLLGLSDGPFAQWKELCSTTAASFIIALAFWHFHIWPSGDAKLFTLLSAFLALFVSPRRPLGAANLSFVHLVNVFLPAGLAFMLRSSILVWGKYHAATTTQKLRAILKFYTCRVFPYREGIGWTQPMQMFFRLLLLQGISLWCYRRLLPPYGQAPLLFAVGGQRLLSQWIPDPDSRNPAAGVGYALAAFAVFTAVFRGYGGPTAAVHAVIYLLLLSGALQMIFVTVDHCMDEVETIDLPAAQLRPHDILAERTKLALLQGEGAESALGKLYPDGLSGEQVRWVQRWCLERGLPKVTVCRAYSFSIWIALGTILTAAMGKDVVSWLRRLFAA